MKRPIALLAILFATLSAHAQIDLTFGVAGSTTSYQQSYNESRGVDMKIISPFDVQVTSMVLGGFYTFANPEAWVCPRIFDPVTHALLASATDTVPHWQGTDIAVPISYTLKAGKTYRIGFYCYGPAEDNGAFMLEPQTFPYNDQYNIVQVQHAYSSAADTIPSNTNIFVPIITINASNLSVPTTKGTIQAAVYPNPAVGNTTVYFGNDQHSACTFTLFNAEGQLLQTITGITDNKIAIQRNDLPAGVYFFKLSREDQSTGTGKFVWQ